MLTVGVLGAGGMGNVHARQYRKMPDVDLVFYEPDAEKAQVYIDRWKATPMASEAELMAKADIVDICLPTDMHVELGMKAIAAGRAVVMEKPLTRTFEEGLQLVRAADKKGVPLMPAQVVRFFPEFSLGNRLVREGKVGTPAAARIRRGGPAPKGTDLWFMDHTRSGGVLLDLAIHDFDWLRWTLGEVKHLYSRSVGAKTMSGPDYALTTLTFDSGAIAHAESTWMDPAGFRTTYEVCGSGGIIECDSRDTPSLRTTIGSNKTVNEGPLSPTDDPYYKQLRSFVEAVQKGVTPPVTALDGLMALSISHAAIESTKTGKVVVPKRP
jgi:predicted dehydrogenase